MKWILLFFLFSLSAYANDCTNCEGRNSAYNTNPAPSSWPLELVKIHSVNYRRDEKAIVCYRPPEIVDTIVLHHSNTSSSTTAYELNDMHIDRSSEGEPWYMIGYSYVVNSAYPGSPQPPTIVSAGRPLNIVGAHAGTNIYVPMSSAQSEAIRDGKIKCGRHGEKFEFNPKLVSGNKISANVSTIGMVVVGNYAPYSKTTNPTGFAARHPIVPSAAAKDTIARTACQLQKQYPRMKSIKWHSYYHPTDCPGTIKDAIADIITRAKRLGCDFQ
jgi:hypothetical protein